MRFLIFIILCLFLFSPENASARLEPYEVAVIVNKKVGESKKLADYYMARRGIPSENLIKLSLSDNAGCKRTVYNREVVAPVRKWLKKHQADKERPIRCLVVMYGMPLKVLPTEMTRDERRQYNKLKNQRDKTYKALKSPSQEESKKKYLQQKYKEINKQLGQFENGNELASLDSELALIEAGDYALRNWQLNPSFVGYRGRSIKGIPDIAYIVARLDGPDPDTVRRMIDDSINAEKNGLRGTAYFDARWPRPNLESGKRLEGYKLYDNSLYKAFDKVNTSGHMRAVVDGQEQLFQPGDCPDAALYCGWYRRGNYLDAFDWRPGSVGYHIASSECAALKGKSNGWCLGMLRDGASAVIGPIGEPYVQAFPLPEIFFSLLLDGRYSLGECFAFSVPYRSWRMVLVGDPLYCPCGNRKKEN